MNERHYHAVLQRLVLFLTTLSMLLAAPPEVPAIGFTFTPIDVPGATATVAVDINNVGQIVGGYTDAAGVGHGFLRSGGSFTTIDVPGAIATEADGINNLGQIVGNFTDAAGVVRGFLLSGGTFTTIDAPVSGATFTSAFGINDSGQIVGEFDVGLEHGFLLSGGSFTIIDVPAAPETGETAAFGINDAGEIVGAFGGFCAVCTQEFGFLLSGGSFTTIAAPFGIFTNSIGINNLGQIVGESFGSDSGHGYLFSGGAFVAIDVPGNTSTSTFGINDAGQIVGAFSEGPNFDPRHGFLATPVPEPSTLVLLGSGLVGLVGVARMRRRGMEHVDHDPATP